MVESSPDLRIFTAISSLARIHRWMARGWRKGGEEVTDATVRARIRVDWRLVAVCKCFWGRRWRPAVAVVSEMAG